MSNLATDHVVPFLKIPAFLHRIISWARRTRLARLLTYLLTCAAIASGIATYFAITQSSSPFGPDPDSVLALVLTDLVLLLVLCVIISRRAIGLWLESRRGSTGSRLQTRIVLLFSLVSVIPTIIVALFSALFFNYGIESWFDKRVSTALEESLAVAEAYLKEHEKVLIADATAMANDLSRSSDLLETDKNLFEQMVATQTKVRALTEAVVFFYDRNAPPISSLNTRILARGWLSFSLTFDLPSPSLIQQASQGEMVVLTDANDNRVRVLTRLEGIPNTYLLVGRFVDNKVLKHMESTQGAAREYKFLKAKISDLQIKFSIIFVIVALLLLFVAVWLGMIFASFFARPISNMITATEKVKEGNLTARVEEGPANDELATLGRAFNRMTTQLERQREALILANQQLDMRRRFSEAVLAGVSAGVIALDANKQVTLFNPSAAALLAPRPDLLQGADFASIIPEVTALLQKAELYPDGLAQDEVVLERNGSRLTLLVRITVEKADDIIEGYVVTFDDITELLAAQRSAAWSDVARRIAHEIKNPLTPIQLAAERLKKKYAQEITSDVDTFNRYTDTITRHVRDIGKMVEEFVNFARMPAPVFARTDIGELVRSIVFSQECANDFVTYKLIVPSTPIMVNCDAGQINQVITNICKNAVESLKQSAYAEKEGCITVTVKRENKNCVIQITDNGKGFPEDLIDRLTEPYVTTRPKGTGLGLAIVRKIVEDHGATLRLSNMPKGGACVTITFPEQYL